MKFMLDIRWYKSWWRHQMGMFYALLALCAGNSPVIAQRPVTRSFDVFFDLPLNKRLHKQWWGLWFETPSRPLWRHCNGCIQMQTVNVLQVALNTLDTQIQLLLGIHVKFGQRWHLLVSRLVLLTAMLITAALQCKLVTKNLTSWRSLGATILVVFHRHAISTIVVRSSFFVISKNCKCVYLQT